MGRELGPPARSASVSFGAVRSRGDRRTFSAAGVRWFQPGLAGRALARPPPPPRGRAGRARRAPRAAALPGLHATGVVRGLTGPQPSPSSSGATRSSCNMRINALCRGCRRMASSRKRSAAFWPSVPAMSSDTARTQAVTTS
jgi:hypothetical protein